MVTAMTTTNSMHPRMLHVDTPAPSSDNQRFIITIGAGGDPHRDRRDAIRSAIGTQRH
jgi:hypothetical protein